MRNNSKTSRSFQNTSPARSLATASSPPPGSDSWKTFFSNKFLTLTRNKLEGKQLITLTLQDKDNFSLQFLSQSRFPLIEWRPPVDGSCPVVPSNCIHQSDPLGRVPLSHLVQWRDVFSVSLSDEIVMPDRFCDNATANVIAVPVASCETPA